ncbi:hypothetical protein R6Q59_009897 [Mikania micrantha]
MTSTHHSTTSYTSSTTTTTSTNGGPPQTHSRSETTRSTYNDRDGSHHERTVTETGKPDIREVRTEPAGAVGAAARIEDVSERDAEAERRYEEAIEDEYAKREGGA